MAGENPTELGSQASYASPLGVGLTAAHQNQRWWVCLFRYPVDMVYRDYTGRRIRLTAERMAHVLWRHPYLAGIEWMIAQTLEAPEEVRRSISDPGSVTLYYPRYTQTGVGDKYMCAVVKESGDDAFVITAYLTDILKEGEII